MGLEAMTPSPAPSRAAVKQLADERDAVERELAATVDALLAPGGGGLSGPLVDADGFPRADIDVALVRTRRNRVATLRNDVEALSATLHQRLQEVDAVHADSPAAAAGLATGDLLVSLGDVSVAQRPAVVELVLRPGPWGGRGVLGCHVVPVRVLEEGFVPQVVTAAAHHGRGE
ncbi:hypothetical protein I4F81_002738 [Pyropia yezoensis]|uniref:Uncharacterized protein n=1 Tax=Pyropia yezoensis TaxID=2788 RepID=A0ACC3BQ85_PYRYE|nr:hypothetical protein I4F81_002738 [Neopyropia yezoensis]